MKTNRLFCVSLSLLSTLALMCIGQGETNAFNKTEILQYRSEDSVVESDPLNNVLIVGRYIAIDNVCAWPNLTMLKDGTIIATIFNKPSHGLIEGDVECWASKDGKLWEKRGTPALHDSAMTNRMNVAAGLAGNGDLVILSSGWLLQPADAPNPPRGSIIRPWICRSADDGKNWVIDKISFPLPESDRTEYIPFGDICRADDGSLRATCYSINRNRKNDYVSMFCSDDDGYTWKKLSTISTEHNETALIPVGGNKWLAAARGSSKPVVDLFYSGDDGRKWKMIQPLTEANQVPGHILRMKSGELLLTYGNRIKDKYGIKAKISNDNGATWSREMMLVDNLSSSDCGYPSSAQLENGDIVTAYYAAGVENHCRYHMGTVIWSLLRE